MAASLLSMAQRAAIRNIDAVVNIGDMPYELAQPILKKITNPDQLQGIEETSPHIADHSAELWQAFIRRDIPNWKEKMLYPKNPRSWGKVYRKLMREKKRELEKAEEQLKASMAEHYKQKEANSSTFVNIVLPEPVRQQEFFDGNRNPNWNKWGECMLPKKATAPKNQVRAFDAGRAKQNAVSELARLRKQAVVPRFLAHDARMTGSKSYTPAIVPPKRPIAMPPRRPVQNSPNTAPTPSTKAPPPSSSPPQSSTKPRAVVPFVTVGVVGEKKAKPDVFKYKPPTSQLDRTVVATGRMIDREVKRRDAEMEDHRREHAKRMAASKSLSLTPPPNNKSAPSTPPRKTTPSPSRTPIVHPPRSLSPVKQIASLDKPTESNSPAKAATPLPVDASSGNKASPATTPSIPSPAAPVAMRKRPATPVSIFMPAKKRRVG